MSCYLYLCSVVDVDCGITEVMADIGEEPAPVETTGGSKYKQILGISAVHFLACWAVIYVGVEVTLGGRFLCALTE